MPTKDLKKFCCEKCERIFRRFAKIKNEEKNMGMKKYGEN